MDYLLGMLGAAIVAAGFIILSRRPDVDARLPKIMIGLGLLLLAISLFLMGFADGVRSAR